jgi:intein/homing endonuclease
MIENKKIKSIKKIGIRETFSIQNNEKELYENTPNFLVEKGFISRNSKHACVYEESNVLTNRGFVKIKDLGENDKIAYLDKHGDMNLTKKYDLIKTGKKKLFTVRTKSGKEIIITMDHELFLKKDNDIESVKLKNIKVGDEILVM